MATRLLEECGEIAAEINLWEDSGNYVLDNLRDAKMKKAKVFMDLSCILMLASRLSDADKKQQKVDIIRV